MLDRFKARKEAVAQAGNALAGDTASPIPEHIENSDIQFLDGLVKKGISDRLNRTLFRAYGMIGIDATHEDGRSFEDECANIRDIIKEKQPGRQGEIGTETIRKYLTGPFKTQFIDKANR